jgi:hypothetical protein
MPDLSMLTGNPQNMMSKLFERLGSDDPTMAMMLQLMQSQQQAAASTDDDPVAISKELELRLSETEEELARVRADAKRLLAAHRIAVERLSELSAALGACGLCWGEDPDCLGCRGRGHIGMIRPDIEIRARLLGPARQAMQAGQSEAKDSQLRSNDNA